MNVFAFISHSYELSKTIPVSLPSFPSRGQRYLARPCQAFSHIMFHVTTTIVRVLRCQWIDVNSLLGFKKCDMD